MNCVSQLIIPCTVLGSLKVVTMVRFIAAYMTTPITTPTARYDGIAAAQYLVVAVSVLVMRGRETG